MLLHLNLVLANEVGVLEVNVLQSLEQGLLGEEALRRTAKLLTRLVHGGTRFGVFISQRNVHQVDAHLEEHRDA